MGDLEDVATLARLVETHIRAGHGLESPALVTDMGTLVYNLHKVLDVLTPPPSEELRVAFLVRETIRHSRGLEKIMADLSGLAAAVAELGTDATDVQTKVLAKLDELNSAVAALQAKVDELVAGEVTQDQIDALADAVNAADASLDETIAAVTPV